MHLRVLLVLLVGAAAASGCTSRTAAVARPTPTAVTALAAPSTVDLRSADGILFLQSRQTGFMEAPPHRPQRQAMAGAAGSPFSKARMWGAPDAPAAPAAAGEASWTGIGSHGVPSGASEPPVAAPPPGAGGRALVPSPHITVRPAALVVEERVDQPSGSLRQALRNTYDANPEINRARSDLRALDEDVAIAKSGNRPVIVARTSTRIESVRSENIGGSAANDFSDNSTPTRFSIGVRQNLFNGFQTRNATREAEASVRAGREQLRNTQQGVLFEAIRAFLDVQLGRELVALARADIRFLEKLVSDSTARLDFGEGTRTDINQAEARLAEARAALAVAQADLAASEASFRRITGLAPARFTLDVDAERMLPRSLTDAVTLGQRNHPQIVGAVHAADAANFNVKEAEGRLLPGVSLDGELGTTIDGGDSGRADRASIGINVEIPIYQGGLPSAQVRQAKEQLGSARISIDIARDQIRDQVVQAWTRYRSELAAIEAARAGIAAAEEAVAGVLEEQAVGQRTTLDVLQTQRDLVDAQVTLARATRNRRLAAFAVLRATGELDVDRLGIPVDVYDPEEHYAAVRDKCTPDGR